MIKAVLLVKMFSSDFHQSLKEGHCHINMSQEIPSMSQKTPTDSN